MPQARKALQERKAVDLSLSDLQSMAREEGEGMETMETESTSSASTPLPSLDQLLTSPDPKQGRYPAFSSAVGGETFNHVLISDMLIHFHRLTLNHYR